MNKKNNLRAVKTQNKIKKIVLQKLETKPLREITVKEICKAAKINRTTFYIHFDNIDDLMLSIDVEMQKGLTDLFRDSANGSFKPLNDENTEQLFNYIYENAIFYRVLLNDLNRLNLLDEELTDSWERDIEPAIRKGANISEAELRYRFEYFNSGVRGIARRWLNTNCQESPKELVQMIKHIVQTSFTIKS